YLVAVGTRVSSRAPRTEPYVRLSRIQLPPRVCDGKANAPSDRHPDSVKRAVVLEAVKVWPGKGGACRKVGATANLDSSCARRRKQSAGRDEETGFQIEQRN